MNFRFFHTFLQNVPETWVTAGRPLGVGFDFQALETETVAQRSPAKVKGQALFWIWPSFFLDL